MPDRIYAAVDEVEMAAAESGMNLAFGESAPQQLVEGKDPALLGSKLCDRTVGPSYEFGTAVVPNS